jgi:hypothetical protein
MLKATTPMKHEQMIEREDQLISVKNELEIAALEIQLRDVKINSLAAEKAAELHVRDVKINSLEAEKAAELRVRDVKMSKLQKENAKLRRKIFEYQQEIAMFAGRSCPERY